MNWYQDLQTYGFLMGLDDTYSTLRTNILNMNPFPDIDRTYAMVVQEESHRGLSGSKNTTPAVGFAAQGTVAQPRTSQGSAPLGDADRTLSGRP